MTLLVVFTYYHSSLQTGDRGFAPYRYDVVDSAFGDWDDVEALGEDYYLMFDFMINHISKKSEMYKTSRKSMTIPSTMISSFVGKSSGKQPVRVVLLKKILTLFTSGKIRLLNKKLTLLTVLRNTSGILLVKNKLTSTLRVRLLKNSSSKLLLTWLSTVLT